ncbi:MAG: 1-phosphofructokinase [Opitutaceae bacterium]|jgi:1-phosphofructokinase
MSSPEITTLTLNPAIDRTVTISGFTAGTVNRVENTSDRPGGKGINVAAALAGHNHAVAALGFLGRDNETAFTSFFAAHGIEDQCLRLPGRTRVGIKITDPVRNETTDINFPGLAPSWADMNAMRARLTSLSGGWCVLAGSLPPGVPTGIYREFITTLKERGVRTVLDSSGEALREALQAAPDIIKPNVHELEAHLGRPLPYEADVIAAARELVAGGVRLVVVSRGADGACFVTADQAIVATPPDITVRSTVGAGDAMVAGIVAAQLRNLSLADTARLATAFSLTALTRMDDGSDSGFTVEAFLSRVQLTTAPKP